MKAFSPLFISSALLALSAAAQAQAGVTVTLSSDAASLSGNDDVVVNVKMTNFSSEAVQVLKWYTPLEQASSGVFNITRNGESVPYVGALIKRGAPTAKDYITIGAGESITRSVELSSLYDLSTTGVYNIEYDVKSLHTYRGSLPASATTKAAAAGTSDQSQDLSSNAIALSIVGRPDVTASVAAAAPRVDVAPQFAASVSFIGCSNTRVTQIRTALTSAETYAGNSLAYLNAGTRGPRYTTWFGTYNATRYSTVRSHFSAISNAAATQPLQFDCSTCPTGPNANAFAYVFANQPYRVYLCNAFWSAPNTGTDSRAGTIVHEMSHFTVLGGTNDFAYGQSAARSLATSNPARAVQNADSHEYFSENTPAQN